MQSTKSCIFQRHITDQTNLTFSACPNILYTIIEYILLAPYRSPHTLNDMILAQQFVCKTHFIFTTDSDSFDSLPYLGPSSWRHRDACRSARRVVSSPAPRQLRKTFSLCRAAIIQRYTETHAQSMIISALTEYCSYMNHLVRRLYSRTL